MLQFLLKKHAHSLIYICLSYCYAVWPGCWISLLQIPVNMKTILIKYLNINEPNNQPPCNQSVFAELLLLISA